LCCLAVQQQQQLTREMETHNSRSFLSLSGAVERSFFIVYPDLKFF
jgi:hypothetical protein